MPKESFSPNQEVVTQVGIMNGSRPTSNRSSLHSRTTGERKHSARKVHIEEKENTHLEPTMNDVSQVYGCYR